MHSCDYHIHTQLSGCADNDLSVEKIIKLQQIRGTESIGITDHDYSYQSKIKTIQAAQQEIKNAEPSIKVHFGVESQMLEYQSTSINIRLAAYFDYVLMTPNHYHLRGVAQPKSFRYNQRHLVDFYQLCLERDVKLLIGSDAHNTKQMGEIVLLDPILKELGITEKNLWHPNTKI